MEPNKNVSQEKESKRTNAGISLADIISCDNNVLLIAALWTVWGAIRQAHKVEPYNEHITSIYDVCKEAMERAKQLYPDPVGADKDESTWPDTNDVYLGSTVQNKPDEV